MTIGFFTTGSANPYAEALNASTVSRAKELGAKITELDSNFDVQTQVNQMQQALARKTYNAWTVTLDDGVEECNQVKAAINAGIPVMVSVGHLCNDDEVGQAGFVGVQTPQAYAAWWKTILGQNPDAKTAFLAGPPLVDLVQSMKKAMDDAFGAHPRASLLSYQNTDWTAQDGFKKTQDLLKAHPDVQVIASSYSLATRGVVQAVQQAGLAGKIKIYDMMGDQFIVEAIKSGVVTLTLPGLPASEGKSAAENLVNRWTGKQAYKVYNPADDAPIPGGPYITKQNAVGYTAQIPS
ncbi:sugar ABC transporter substrate-binding protein [Amycolatopsis pigmentata]|uniref:Sugar ABC transporter substrate-binding protein n=1 Tax=Amycolatopsis pigmentata TaxID=450801 RepID=A0ABW5FN26_9PSEU